MKKCQGFTLTELIVVIAMGSVFFALVFHLVNHSYEIFNNIDSTSYNYLEEKTINNTFSTLCNKVNKNRNYSLNILYTEEVVLRVIDSNKNIIEELIIYDDHFIYADFEYQLKEYKLNIVYNPNNKYFIVEYYQDENVVHQEVFYVIRGIINEEE